MVSLRRSLLAGFLLVAISSPAAAFPLTYTLSGTIDFVDSALTAASPPFAMGQSFVFSFSLDSTTTSIPLGGGAVQYIGVDAFSITLNGVYTLDVVAPGVAGNVSVTDGSPRDQFQTFLQAIPGTGTSYPSDLGIYRAMQVVTTLHDAAGATFSSTALPLSLDPADWTYINNVQMIFRDPANLADQVSVLGSVNAMAVQVPEPHGALLVATGLGLLSVALRRRGRDPRRSIARPA